MVSSTGIVVGLCESPSGVAALRWAVDQARRTGTRLLAVHVLTWPIGTSTFGLSEPGETLHVSEHHIDRAYRRAVRAFFAEASPLPDWQLQFDEGEIGHVLARESEAADLLVVGTREHSEGGRLEAGSVSHYCVAHASCPVVTVPVEFFSTQAFSV